MYAYISIHGTFEDYKLLHTFYISSSSCTCSAKVELSMPHATYIRFMQTEFLFSLIRLLDHMIYKQSELQTHDNFQRNYRHKAAES